MISGIPYLFFGIHNSMIYVYFDLLEGGFK